MDNNSDHPNVFKLIESLMLPPIHFIVEAGSFVGSSANMWAKFARRHNATVLCIDTWEGDVNMCEFSHNDHICCFIFI